MLLVVFPLTHRFIIFEIIIKTALKRPEGYQIKFTSSHSIHYKLGKLDLMPDSYED